MGRAATVVRAAASEVAAVAAQEVAATLSQHRQSRPRPEPIPSRAVLWWAFLPRVPVGHSQSTLVYSMNYKHHTQQLAAAAQVCLVPEVQLSVLFSVQFFDLLKS